MCRQVHHISLLNLELCSAMFCCWACYIVSCLLVLLLEENQTNEAVASCSLFLLISSIMMAQRLNVYHDWCLLGQQPMTKCLSTFSVVSPLYGGRSVGDRCERLGPIPRSPPWGRLTVSEGDWHTDAVLQMGPAVLRARYGGLRCQVFTEVIAAEIPASSRSSLQCQRTPPHVDSAVMLLLQRVPRSMRLDLWHAVC